MRGGDGDVILVSIEHEGGTAAIVREHDGTVGLEPYFGREGPGLRLLSEPLSAGVERGRMVTGGLLPEGATGAEVVDDAGQRVTASASNGAWLTVLQLTGRVRPPTPIRFFAASGETVEAPLAAEWPRVPITDAEDPCPACGSLEWEQWTPTDLDPSRPAQGGDEGNMEPVPFIRCRVCGHEEVEGGWLTFAPWTEEDEEAEAEESDAEERERRIREVKAGLHGRWEQASRGVDFPVYAAVGREPSLAGWRGLSGAANGVTIAHEDRRDGGEGPCLRVQTEMAERHHGGDTTRSIAQSALKDVLPTGDPLRGASQSAQALRLSASERERHRVAAQAAASPVLLPIDGAPREFELIEADGRWAAVREHGEVTITVKGVDILPTDVKLERVKDPSGLRSAW